MIPHRYPRRALFTAIAFIPFAATAQTAERDALNSPTTTSTAPYQSAFAEYKNFQDTELVSWRAANDVVREFGSMAKMEGMNGDNGAESTGGAGDPKNKDEAKTEQRNRPLEPAHEMGKMNEKSLPTSPKNSVSSGSKSSGMDSPGHDMSKMNGTPKPNKTKAPPDADMKGMEGMGNMPGHDMGSMKGKAAPTPPAKQPAPVTKPATPQAMPDHSGMQKQ